MSDEEQDTLPLSQDMRNMHDRLSAVETLMANVYAKYYCEQYPDATLEAKKSLRRIEEEKYSLYSNFSFIDRLHESRVRSHIKRFFNHLDSIISMSVKTKNQTQNGGSGVVHGDPGSLQFAAHIQSLLHEKLPQFKGLEVDQIYEVEPASDLVLRVWLKNKVTKQPILSLIVKILGQNPVRNDIVDKYGLFYREASFYSSLAQPIHAFVPGCYYASVDESLLILEDKGRGVVGDQLYGYHAEEALSVISAMVPFHDYWFNKQPGCFLPQVNDPEIMEILPEMLMHAWAATKKFLNADNSPRIDSIIDDVATNLKPIADELSKHATVIHGDLRMENLLFEKMKLAAIVDWQLLSIGSPMIDVAYFLVQSGCAEERNQVEDQILALYSQKFSPVGLDLERVKLEYDLAKKHSLIIPIMGAAWDLHASEKPREIVTSAFYRTIEALG